MEGNTALFTGRHISLLFVQKNSLSQGTSAANTLEKVNSAQRSANASAFKMHRNVRKRDSWRIVSQHFLMSFSSLKEKTLPWSSFPFRTPQHYPVHHSPMFQRVPLGSPAGMSLFLLSPEEMLQISPILSVAFILRTPSCGVSHFPGFPKVTWPHRPHDSFAPS
jgi:hypothetical protein